MLGVGDDVLNESNRPVRVLVTGADGFVGRGLGTVLARNGFVPVAGRRERGQPLLGYPDVVHHGDLANRVPDVEVDAIVHLAGLAHTRGGSALAYHDANVASARSVAKLAARCGALLVLVSSVKAQIGDSADGVLTERDEPRPESFYGRSKLMAEMEVGRLHDVRSVVLRPCVVAGPGARNALGHLARLVSAGVPVPLGGADGRRSMASLGDLHDAVVFALQTPALVGGTFLVADERAMTMPEVVRAMAMGRSSRRSPLVLDRRILRPVRRMPGISRMLTMADRDLVVSSASLRSMGWSPAGDIAETLATMVNEAVAGDPVARSTAG